MSKQYTFTLDDSCVEWYDYHFQDAILRNDIVWRCWREAVQRRLTVEQLEGRSCALCGRCITSKLLVISEYVGGYKLSICVRRCETPLERSMRMAIDDVEALAAKHKRMLQRHAAQTASPVSTKKKP